MNFDRSRFPLKPTATETKLKIFVLRNPSAVAPVILPFSYDELVNVGDALELFCSIVKGDKPISIKWTFERANAIGGHTQLPSKRLTDTASMLSILAASAKHTGNYTCTATNRAGSVSHTTSITVNGTLEKIII